MSASAEIQVRIPGGLWRDGGRVQDVGLRPLVGRDEAFLVDCEGGRSAAAGNALLARCVATLGRGSPPTPADLMSLTVGDREALLLHLRRHAFGDRLVAVALCPDGACAERADVDLRVQDLLQPAYTEARPEYERIVGGSAQPVRVGFRLPNAGDLETAASLQARGVEHAASEILYRCLRRVDDAVTGEPLASWPQDLRGHLASLFVDLDPQAETRLILECPACGGPYTVLLDAASYLMAELAPHAAALLQETHLIASHYHWSEADILSLSPGRRRRYLELIQTGLSQARTP